MGKKVFERRVFIHPSIHPIYVIMTWLDSSENVLFLHNQLSNLTY